MIKAEGIGYKVGPKFLVKDVSVSFEPGKLHLIIGPNGAGKSTLLKLLCGQLHPHTGTVTFNDKPLAAYTISSLARIRSVLSQNLVLSFPLKVWEVVLMGRYAHFTGSPGQKDMDACGEAMKFFEVTEFSERDYTTLSGGEKQRVQFARILAQVWYAIPGQCRYVFLDEPLTFLDVHHQHELLQKLRQLLAGDMVIVGIIHDLNLASTYADHLTLIYNSAVLSDGVPEYVLRPELIQTAYVLRPEIFNLNGRRYIIF